MEGSKRSLILNGETWKTADDAGWQAFRVEGDLPRSQGPGIHHGPRRARPEAGGGRGGGRVEIFIAPVRAKAGPGKGEYLMCLPTTDVFSGPAPWRKVTAKIWRTACAFQILSPALES